MTKRIAVVVLPWEKHAKSRSFEVCELGVSRAMKQITEKPDIQRNRPRKTKRMESPVINKAVYLQYKAPIFCIACVSLGVGWYRLNGEMSCDSWLRSLGSLLLGVL